MVVAENTMEQRLLEAEAATERLRRECAESATRVADLEARLAERATCPGTQAVEELIKMREERARALLDGVDAERHALGHTADALEAENERLRGLLREMTASLETQTRQSAEIVAESAKTRAEIDDVRTVLGASEGETLLAAAQSIRDVLAARGGETAIEAARRAGEPIRAAVEAANTARKLAAARARITYLEQHLAGAQRDARELRSDLAGLAAREAVHVEDRTPDQQTAALAPWRADPPHVVRTEAPGEVVSVEVRRAEQEAAHLRAKLATAEQEISKLRGDLDDVNGEADALVDEGLSKVDAADLEDLRALATQVVEAWDHSDRSRMEEAVAMLRELSDADDPPEAPQMFEPRPPRPLPTPSTGEHVQRYVEAMRGDQL